MLRQFFHVAALGAITQFTQGLDIQTAPKELMIDNEHGLTQVNAEASKQLHQSLHEFAQIDSASANRLFDDRDFGMAPSEATNAAQVRAEGIASPADVAERAQA